VVYSTKGQITFVHPGPVTDIMKFVGSRRQERAAEKAHTWGTGAYGLPKTEAGPELRKVIRPGPCK
jgi:hypothetical protein